MLVQNSLYIDLWDVWTLGSSLAVTWNPPSTETQG